MLNCPDNTAFVPPTERLDPRRAKLLKEIEDPIPTIPRIDRFPPDLNMLRTDRLDPSEVKSRTEVLLQEPIAASPATDKLEPILTKERREIEDPSAANWKQLRLPPDRQKLRTERLEPK
jgi:hypothetical protein